MRNDDRVPCSHCGRRMVPRIITAQGELRESVCPFCGGTYLTFERQTSAFLKIVLGVIGAICLIPFLMGLLSGLFGWIER